MPTQEEYYAQLDEVLAKVGRASLKTLKTMMRLIDFPALLARAQAVGLPQSKIDKIQAVHDILVTQANAGVPTEDQ